ncbi:hypothetical protein V6N12_029943 [Hibiscus sabdariffa]
MERFQAFGGGQSHQMEIRKISETEGSSSTSTSGLPSGMEGEGMFLNQSKPGCCSLLPNPTTLFPLGPSSVVVDDLHRLVSFQQPTLNQQQYYNPNHPHPHLHLHHHQQQQPEFSTLPQQSQAQQLSLNVLPATLASPTAFPDRLWEWNLIPEANKEYNNPFK